MLWLLPAGFILSSTALAVVGRGYLGLGEAATGTLGFSSFFLCLIGSAWSDFKIAGPGWKAVFSMAGSMALYVVCQLILAPIILMLCFAILTIVS